MSDISGVRTSANLIKPLVRDADNHYLDPRSSISNDGGLSLRVPGPLPAGNTTTASSFTPSSSKSQRLQVKKKRRKTLSEILRSKGHCIREATQKEDGESSGESGQGTLTMWKQSLNCYTLPDVNYPSCSKMQSSPSTAAFSIILRLNNSVIKMWDPRVIWLCNPLVEMNCPQKWYSIPLVTSGGGKTGARSSWSYLLLQLNTA